MAKRIAEDGLELTAVYIKGAYGYVGYLQELPGISAHGRTLNEARDWLRKITVVVFDEERRNAAELLGDREAVREAFLPDSLPRQV